ncbi:MAG TPA: DUF362 domain-containing protein [Gemmataceae bacterium]|nr:DUF362 domain-containing protein [Gemmataceae bacterium]
MAMSRRGFLYGAAAGVPLGWLAYRALHPGFTGRSVEVPRPALAMPGPFPGRVVEVRHPGVLDARNTVDAPTVRTMMQHGMSRLVGGDVDSAWRRFFQRDDIVGIKVNPVGRKAKPGETGRRDVGVISSPEILVETVRCLHEYVGVPKRNIIVFERYANEFRDAGYEQVLRTRPMQGVQWYASAYQYDETQTQIDGQNSRAGRDPKVVGYDPDVFVSMGFASPSHDRHDERKHRTHLSVIVSRMINKLITIPNLKDHKSAGVTIALKNMSHGMNNNVARSHIGSVYRLDGSISGPNQCNTFIPTAINQRPLLEKATLHICDGLIGVYEGGPGSWNRHWGTWQRKSIFFATDPVALDHVGWDIIDRKRLELGWLPVGDMGRIQHGPIAPLPANLATLAALTPPFGSAAVLLSHQRIGPPFDEPFDRRQPEHVALAGLLGLGRFDARDIDHRVVELSR